MKSKVEFVRERPLGMIPFVAGLAVAGGAVAAIGSGGFENIFVGMLGLGAFMMAAGVAQFRRPHRIELCGRDAVRIAGRFGAPKAWRSARLKTPPSQAQVALEAAFFALVMPTWVWASDRPLTPGALQLFAMGAAYAHAWRQWRLAPRLLVSDEAGKQKTVRVDGIDGAADALAARESRSVALVG